MKLALSGGFSVIALLIVAATIPAIASAQTTVDIIASSTIQQTPPVTLVNLAQQGYLRNQGIPSSQALTQAIAAGQVTPETLVQAGIRNNLVTPNTPNDQGYLNIVEVQFRDIVQDFTISSSEVSN